MLDAHGYLLLSLVLMLIICIIIFVWLSIIGKTLEEIQSAINHTEDILCKMNSLLSAQNVDAKRLTDDGWPLPLLQKPHG